tara:strand:+ start:306 stop:548 length:243 start_codon:yes stop_codon:yes gene_type:complete
MVRGRTLKPREAPLGITNFDESKAYGVLKGWLGVRLQRKKKWFDGLSVPDSSQGGGCQSSKEQILVFQGFGKFRDSFTKP